MTDKQQEALLAANLREIRQTIKPGTWVVAKRVGGLVLILTAKWYEEGNVWHLKSIIDLSKQDMDELKSMFSEEMEDTP